MLEWSTLVLAVFTVVLSGATIWYAIETHKMNKASEKTQKSVEEQNNIMRIHNESLKQQSEAQVNLVEVLKTINLELRGVGDAVNNFKTMIRQEKFNEIKDEEIKKMKNRT